MTDNPHGDAGWSKAEERVGSLYRSFGFTVTRDVLNRGSQIDLVAEQRMPGVGLMRIGVEVKDHPNGSVPIAEVRAFLNTARPAVSRGDFNMMHLITTGSVTRSGRAEVDGESAVRLMTYEELERDLFEPDSALGRWLELYNREPISRRFVEVTATLLGSEPAGSGGADLHLPSTGLLDVALANPSLAVVVLADYGSGKSTMLERIKALAIERRSEHRGDVVPILIRLRDIGPDFDVEKIALDAFRSELGFEVHAELFWGHLRRGRFLILLDGFDELTLQASAATRERMLSGISPLLFAPSPAILTSRPSYFASLDEYRTMLSRMRVGRPAPDPGAPDQQRIERHVSRLVDRYRAKGPKAPVEAQVVTYELDPLRSDQIDKFLDHAAPELDAAGTTPQEVRRFLDSVYDLSDLISRPIILDMAVTSTVDGVITPGQQTLEDGPAGLYEAYAQVRLERDWSNVANRQELMTHEIRMRFAEECALFMHERSVLRVERSEIASVAARALPLGKGEDLEAVLTDLRTCSFLTIDDHGALEFIHRSYQEFFVARRIRDDLSRSSTVRLREPLRWEFAYFLGSMGYTNNDIYRAFTELARVRTDQTTGAGAVGDNAAQALLIAREANRDLDWRRRRIGKLQRSRSQIAHSTLQDVELSGVRADHLELSDCSLALRIAGDPLGDLTLTNCTGNVEVSGEINSLSAGGGSLTLRNRTEASSLSFDSMDLVLRSGGGHHRFHNVTGRCELGASTVDIVQSDFAIGASGIVQGTIIDALVDIPLDGWDLLATQVTRSAVVVRGARSHSTVSTAIQRTKKVTDEPRGGTDAVIVVDPTVVADRWWPRQQGLVTIGARITDNRTQMLGLFVHEQQRNSAATPPADGTANPEGQDVLQFWHDGEHTVVMEGKGPGFDAARGRLSDVIKKSSARSVASGQWLTKHLSPLLIDLGCPQDVMSRLVSLIESKIASAGPHV